MMKYGVLGKQLQLDGIEVACSRCNRKSWTTLTTLGRSDCCNAPRRATGRRAESIPKNGEMPRSKSMDPSGQIPRAGGIYINSSRLSDF